MSNSRSQFNGAINFDTTLANTLREAGDGDAARVNNTGM